MVDPGTPVDLRRASSTSVDTLFDASRLCLSLRFKCGDVEVMSSLQVLLFGEIFLTRTALESPQFAWMIKLSIMRTITAVVPDSISYFLSYSSVCINTLVKSGSHTFSGI